MAQKNLRVNIYRPKIEVWNLREKMKETMKMKNLRLKQKISQTIKNEASKCICVLISRNLHNKYLPDPKHEN